MKLTLGAFGVASAFISLRAVLVAYIVASDAAHKGWSGLVGTAAELKYESLFPEFWVLAGLSCVAGFVSLCFQVRSVNRCWAREWLYFLGFVGFTAIAALTFSAVSNRRLFYSSNGEPLIWTLLLFGPYVLFQLSRSVVWAWKARQGSSPPFQGPL